MEKSNAVVEFIKILDSIRDRSTRDKPSFNIDIKWLLILSE